MNKGIIIAISIAIIVGIFGISFMSMEPEAANISNSVTETQNSSEPKRYSASLSENVGISTP